MKNIINSRNKLHIKSEKFTIELNNIKSERIKKNNDPKTFDELWDRYQDLGEIGQIWSSINRTEVLINYCLQLLYRDIALDITVDKELKKKLNKIKTNKLFAEKVLLGDKKELFILGYTKQFNSECPKEKELKDFHGLRNMFAHSIISYSNNHKAYYIEDRNKNTVSNIPLSFFIEEVQNNLRILFPWLSDVASKLFKMSVWP